MTNIIEYRYKCTTEDLWIYELRKEQNGVPTQCKNNAGHTIDANSIVITEKIDQQVSDVRIKRSELIDPEVAMTQDKGWDIIVKTGDTKSEIAERFPFNVDLINGYIRNKDAQDDDCFEAFGAPSEEQSIGTVSTAATKGDTDVILDATAYAEVTIGHTVRFANDETCYRIIDKNDGTNTITIHPTQEPGVTNNGLAKNLAADSAIKFIRELIVGTVAQDADAGVNEVILDNTAYAASRHNFWIQFGSDTKWYRIISTDDETNKVFLQPVLRDVRTTGDYVKIRRAFIERLAIDTADRFPLAREVEDASGIESYYVIKGIYHHTTPPASDGKIKLTLVFRC